MEAIEKTAADINPIGRVLPLAGNDTDDEDGKLLIYIYITLNLIFFF